MTASHHVAKIIIQKSLGSKWAGVDSFVDEVAALIERELRLPEVVADLRACYTSPADHNKLFPNFTENADRRLGAINFRAERALSVLGENILPDNDDGYTHECLCEVCGRQFALPGKNAPHRCGCDKPNPA